MQVDDPGPGPSWQVQLLGRFSVSQGAARVALRPSTRHLVALVAVRGALSRRDAAGLMWPDLTHVRATGNLRTALWRLRRDASGLIVEDDDSVALGRAAIDLTTVRRWAWQALRNEDGSSAVPDGATQELLPGWDDEWLVVQREELRLLQLYALESASQRLLMSGKLGEAAAMAAAALAVDPIRESANRLLIEIHLREGNRWDAVRRFRRYEALLREELQVDPSPGLVALVAPLTRSG